MIVGKSFPRYTTVVALSLLLVGCGSDQSPPATAIAPLAEEAGAAEVSGAPAPISATLELTSTAFGSNEEIPAKYSCDGEDISPPLDWGDPPEGTRSFALIFDDPDAVGVAGLTWVHWILFDLPGDSGGLSEGIPPDAELIGGGRHGQNSWDRLGYGGPCPPRGTHRYFFKLYALDTVLSLEAGASKERLLEAMADHVLAQGELMGTFTR